MWFGSIFQVINPITMLSLNLSGAALVRERDRGTLDRLPALPVTPLEIMLTKVWSMGLVVLLAAATRLILIVQGVLQGPMPVRCRCFCSARLCISSPPPPWGC